MIAYFTLYKNMILGGIFVSLVLALFIQTYRINSYKAELAQSTAQVAILANSIETSNKAVEKLSKDSAERTESSAKALKEAQAMSASNQSKLIALKAQLGKIPTCDLAVTNAKANI
jgi:hypothetical protein